MLYKSRQRRLERVKQQDENDEAQHQEPQHDIADKPDAFHSAPILVLTVDGKRWTVDEARGTNGKRCWMVDDDHEARTMDGGR